MLDRLSEVGVPVNGDKNVFGLTMFKLLGQKLSNDGGSPS